MQEMGAKVKEEMLRVEGVCGRGREMRRRVIVERAEAERAREGDGGKP